MQLRNTHIGIGQNLSNDLSDRSIKIARQTRLSHSSLQQRSPVHPSSNQGRPLND
jgi:hypothetical protein